MKTLRPAIFMHIQKTAGTTIVNLARSAYGNHDIISHGDYLEGVSHFPLKKDFKVNEQVLHDFQKVPFLSGHFGYAFAKQYMRDRYSFTFLRNPVERVLSFYYFCRTRDPNAFEIYSLSQKTTLNGFLQMGLVEPEVKYYIWNNQVWQLACGFGSLDNRALSSFERGELLDLALSHLDEFSYIGFAESFEQDRDRVLTDLGIETPKEKIVSNATPGRPVSDDLPQSTVALLLELTELDRVLYEKVQSRKMSHAHKGIRK